MAMIQGMDSLQDLCGMEIDIPRRRVLGERRRYAKKHRLRTLVCVLEDPKTVANIGSIIRSVNAFGVSKLYIVDRLRTYREDQYLLKKLSVGSNQWTFIRTFESTKECMDLLKKRGYTSIATSPHTMNKTNIELGRGAFTDRKLAVWFGNESKGLTPEAIDSCDRCVQIPMRGMVESHNLASSVAIVLHVIVDQRTHFRNKSPMQG